LPLLPEIGRNLIEAARAAKRRFVIVSRRDSTLRGHFPGEMDALTQIQGIQFDGKRRLPSNLEIY